MPFDVQGEYAWTKEGGVGRDHKEPVTHFDFEELDRLLGTSEEEDTVAPYGEALIALLAFIVGDTPGDPDSPFGISSRALGVAYMLRPDIAGFDSLSAIARHCAVTKQALSKALLHLRDSAGWVHCRHVKQETTRATYREAAHEGWKTRMANLKRGHRTPTDRNARLDAVGD